MADLDKYTEGAKVFLVKYFLAKKKDYAISLFKGCELNLPVSHRSAPKALVNPVRTQRCFDVMDVEKTSKRRRVLTGKLYKFLWERFSLE